MVVSVGRSPVLSSGSVILVAAFYMVFTLTARRVLCCFWRSRFLAIAQLSSLLVYLPSGAFDFLAKCRVNLATIVISQSSVLRDDYTR